MNAVRKLFPFVKPYWLWSLISLVLLAAVVLMDLAIPRLVQRIIDQGIHDNNMGVVLQTSLLMLGISALSTVFAIGNNNFSIKAAESVARDLREAQFIKIQAFSYANLDHFTTGRLMVRLSSDTTAVQRLVQITLRIGTRAPLLMIGSLILMIRTGPQLALSIVPLLLVTSVVIVVFSLKMEPLFRSMQGKLDRLNTVMQENIAGVRVVKAFVRADHERARFEVANEDFTQRSVRVMQFMSSMQPALTIFVNIGVVLVIWVGGQQAIAGQLTLGEIVAFINYLMTTMGPLIMMTMLSNVWANGIVSAQRINEVLDMPLDVQPAPDARPLPDGRGRVEFRGVSFYYRGEGSQEAPVLQEINLLAEPGQTLAILGATGVGKTTLVELIPRFYDVTAGQVLIDGLDVRQATPESLLAAVGIVPQESILFSGTAADNVRYGRPEATDEEVIAAAQLAQAHDFISKLPQGYQTHVEQRGVNLSGGQKQRIAIARAVLLRPRVLILDDSTSAVDVETETLIHDAIDAVMHERTIFMVAQRISTVLKADKIVVLENGRIVAEGTHGELMQTSRVYQEIYDSQLGSGELSAEALLAAATQPAAASVPGKAAGDGK